MNEKQFSCTLFFLLFPKAQFVNKIYLFFSWQIKFIKNQVKKILLCTNSKTEKFFSSSNPFFYKHFPHHYDNERLRGVKIFTSHPFFFFFTPAMKNDFHFHFHTFLFVNAMITSSSSGMRDGEGEKFNWMKIVQGHLCFRQ